jgi:hypothetical protein
MTGIEKGLKVGQEAILNLISSAFQKIGAFLPDLLGSLIILFLGWIVALILRGISRRVFRIIGIKYLAERSGVNELLKKLGIQKRAEDLLASLVYLAVLLIVVVAATEVLGITIVIDTLNSFINYLPKIFGAIFVFIFVSYLGKLVRQVVSNFLESYKIAYASAVGIFLEVLISVFAIIMALRELGFETTIFTANITLVIALLFSAMALAIGLGGKSIAEKILAGFYLRKYLSSGQEVEINGLKGRVKDFQATALIIETEDGEVALPNDRVLTEILKVKK